jgi:hypothetical protein
MQGKFKYLLSEKPPPHILFSAVARTQRSLKNLLKFLGYGETSRLFSVIAIIQREK